ncbi:TetR/AcrR family transcriptional regulator [Geomicrobium sp. JSM 1781026]|uniref:TetR/AcrR family transcriptional regulator n=1 Tax=Geomicrobium sp. JSM 1781026 TaxID=3344580 RepID=UPI0035C177CB
MHDSYPDLRVKRTRRAIKRAFTELLHEMPLEKITVHTLAKRAEINRVTFYDHYHDIYNLADHFISDKLYDIRTALTLENTDIDEDQRAEQALSRLLEHIAVNEQVYRMLLVDQQLPAFTKKLTNLLHSLILKPDPANAFYSIQTPEEVARWYASSALLGTISMWLEHGMPYTPKVLAEQLIKLNPFRNDNS